MFAFRNLLTLPLAPTGNILMGILPSTGTMLGPASFPATNLLTQRWKYRSRKPIGSPRSRKKRYYVRVPTPRDPEEMAELFWRYNHYRTETRSLMEHFAKWKLEHYPAEAANVGLSSVKEEPVHVIDADFERVLQENEQENARVAVAREARRADELDRREEHRMEDLMDWQDREDEETAMRDAQIRLKKEAITKMVTPETLDERIAHAYDNPVDYNFCIFMNGKRVYGRPDPLNRINMAYQPREQVVSTDQGRDAQPDQKSTARNE